MDDYDGNRNDDIEPEYMSVDWNSDSDLSDLASDIEDPFNGVYI